MLSGQSLFSVDRTQHPLNRQGVRESKNILEVLLLTNSDTIVLLDFDNTIARPKDSKDTGSDAWFLAVYTAICSSVKDDSLALRTILAVYDEVQRITQVKPVEHTVIDVINMLREHDVPVYIITSRGSRLVETTERQLNDLGIEQLSSHDLFYLQCKSGELRPAVRNGVIYCDGYDKGICAETFFESMAVDPKRVVMVDDTVKHLHNTNREVTRANREFFGLHYTFLSERVQQFEIKVSAARLIEMARHFNNDAKNVIESHPEAFGLSREHLCQLRN